MGEVRRYRQYGMLDDYGKNFLSQVCHHRILTREEEIMYAKRVQKGDREAVDIMLMSNMRLLASRAKHFAFKYERRDLYVSLVMDGFEGLYKAVQRFDPKRKVRFSTYGQWWIDQAIRRSAELKRFVRVPDYMDVWMRHFAKVIGDYSKRTGSEMSDNDAYRALNHQIPELTPKYIPLMRAIYNRAHPMSITGLEEIIEDKTRGDLSLCGAVDEVFIDRMITKALDKRSAMVIRMRYGIRTHNGQPMTLKEVGEMLRVTRERIRQIEKEALTRLRKYCSRMKIPGPN